MKEKDYLWLNLRELPYFRAFLRAIEGKFYENLEMPDPILDLGCGDGSFTRITFDMPLDAGIDPWTGPVHKAGKSGSYRHVIQGDGHQMPFENHQFQTVISNSVLEHIPDLQPVLEDVGRVLVPGGLFYFCVPNHQFLPNLSVAKFLDRIHLKSLASLYRKFFNWIARHYHCHNPETWNEMLDKAGFEIVDWWHYFSPEALAVLEWGHYFGLPSAISHILFKKWILVPQPWNLLFTRKIVERFTQEDPRTPEGTCTFYIAKKKLSA